LGIALRNAGFGLQFSAAGESFDEPVVNELGQLSRETPEPATSDGQSGQPDADSKPLEDDPIAKAMKTPCPIKKYNGKTLGDVIAYDPGAIVWVANKFTDDPAISAAAKLLCEHSVATTA